MHTIAKEGRCYLKEGININYCFLPNFALCSNDLPIRINAKLVMEIISPGAKIHHQYPKISADEK